MCGRFALAAPAADLIEFFDLATCEDFPLRYNIPPGTDIPVIRYSPEGQRVLHLLRWGLIPHWSKDPSIGNRQANARAESLTEKPAFRDAFKARFQRDFGSFSLMAYDTANIIFSALKYRSGDEDMKRALLKYGPYAGVQQQTRFDANGDTPRKVYYTEIRKGSFVQVK